MPNPETLLKELGLTEYEAKAYLVLAAKGDLTAERVSSLAKIPLPRVYDTMTSLSERGLVIVTKTRPQKFSSISPNKILGLVKEDEQKKLDRKMKKIEDIMPEILKNIKKAEYEEEPDTLSYVKRQGSMEFALVDIHKRAQKSVIIFAGDLYWLNQTSKLIKRAIKRGVKYKIIWASKSDQVTRRAKTLSALGVKMRHNPEIGLLRAVIIDNKWTRLFQFPDIDYHKPPQKLLSDKHTNFTTLIISNKLISSIFNSYFNILWQMSIKKNK